MKTENIVKIMMGITGIGFLLTAAFIAGIFIFPNKNFPEPQVFVPHKAGQIKQAEDKAAYTDSQESTEIVVEETALNEVVKADPSILNECHSPSKDEIEHFSKLLMPSSTLSLPYKKFTPLQICNLTNTKQAVVYSYETTIFLTDIIVKRQAISVIGKDFSRYGFNGADFLCPKVIIDDVTEADILGHCEFTDTRENTNVNFTMGYSYTDAELLHQYARDSYSKPIWEMVEYADDENPEIVYCDYHTPEDTAFKTVLNLSNYFYYCQLSNGHKLVELNNGDHGDYGYVYHHIAELDEYNDVVKLTKPLQCSRHSENIQVQSLENNTLRVSCSYGDGPCSMMQVYDLDPQTMEVKDSTEEQQCDMELFN
ncbi:MAG: hypothetical protein P1P90_00705 [Patescibacteria group bacterium]|nr:hypothetical protein [Patescibacteria group bacterium]